jgi:hypothetical protein
MMDRQERIRELGSKILAICAQCPHVKWLTGHFECSVKRSHCHSKRVRRYLAEIERLEANGTRKG